VLYSVTSLSGPPVFVWYAVRCGLKSGYQKDMCLKVIGLCAQVSKIILASIVTTIGGLGGSSKVPVILTLKNHSINMRDRYNP
jgi:hypothetical protein